MNIETTDMTRIYQCLLLIIVLLCGSSINLIAQDLPHYLTPEEERLLEDYNRQRQVRSALPDAPTSPVRTMAEWEEIEGLLIRWEGTWVRPLLRDITRYAQEEVEVYIVTQDSNSVRNYLSNGGVPITNITFLDEESNSIWARDYGQWTVYDNEVGGKRFIDWIYNRPRPDDDVVPEALATLLNVPLHQTINAPNDLVNTGGNFMVDGFGTAFASELILEENEPGNPYGVSSKSEAQIDTIMKNYMGINRYIKMPVLPYDGIHHIDMHMKLLDEQTLLIGEYPTGVADGPQIESNLNYVLNNFNSMFGTPYKIIRIPMPPHNGVYPDNWNSDYRTYTNSVIVNKTVLVPVYEEQFDTTALRIYREAMPGYRIIGLDCNDIIQASGAIHCITKAVGVDDPLLISHQSLENTGNTSTSYQVDAYINHRTGIEHAELYYTTDTTQAYQAVNMTLTNSPTDTWTGYIPPQPGGTEVFYYVDATANSGKNQVRPIVAPNGYWNFFIEALTGKEKLSLNEVVSNLEVYPNPAVEHGLINFTASTSISGRIVIRDLLGKELMEVYTGSFTEGNNIYFANVSHLASGTYLISIETNTGRITKRLLKE